MKRTYEVLLRLYPYDYRSWFGAEMWRTFEETACDRLARGRWAWMRLALAELIGLLAGAGAEWFCEAHDQQVSQGALPSGFADDAACRREPRNMVRARG